MKITRRQIRKLVRESRFNPYADFTMEWYGDEQAVIARFFDEAYDYAVDTLIKNAIVSLEREDNSVFRTIIDQLGFDKVKTYYADGTVSWLLNRVIPDYVKSNPNNLEDIEVFYHLGNFQPDRRSGVWSPRVGLTKRVKEEVRKDPVMGEKMKKLEELFVVYNEFNEALVSGKDEDAQQLLDIALMGPEYYVQAFDLYSNLYR